MYMHTLKCTHFPGTSRAILIQRRCYFRSPCYYEYIAKSTFCFCRHHVFVEKVVYITISIAHFDNKLRITKSIN